LRPSPWPDLARLHDGGGDLSVAASAYCRRKTH
jgi:hypothetical protein